VCRVCMEYLGIVGDDDQINATLVITLQSTVPVYEGALPVW
jgi:hypothetical protein